jgi:hypothetical protein
MKELQALLVKCDVVFNHLNNCIMCFPHIINICTAHIVAASTQVNQKYLDSDSLDGDNNNGNYEPSSPSYQTGPQLDEAFITMQPPEHQAWLRSLSHNPVKLIADIVCHICASDARKQSFADIIHLCTKDNPKLHSALPLQLI